MVATLLCSQHHNYRIKFFNLQDDKLKVTKFCKRIAVFPAPCKIHTYCAGLQSVFVNIAQLYSCIINHVL